MRRKDNDIIKELEKFFDELAHNFAIDTCLDRVDDEQRYVLERIYFCLYEEE